MTEVGSAALKTGIENRQNTTHNQLMQLIHRRMRGWLPNACGCCSWSFIIRSRMIGAENAPILNHDNRIGYRCLMKSSVETPACLMIPERVPGLISLWSGTTQPVEARLITTWLPFCRIFRKPNLSSALIHSFPLNLGSFGIRNLECCHKRLTHW